MTEMCCEYLSVWCNCQYVIIMSRMRFRVNIYSRQTTINTLLTTQLNHLASLAKSLSVSLETKCLWVRIPLLPVKLQISRLFREKTSLTLRQLWSVDSLSNVYVA